MLYAATRSDGWRCLKFDKKASIYFDWRHHEIRN